MGHYDKYADRASGTKCYQDVTGSGCLSFLLPELKY